jgi:hypothetical protein
LLGARAKRLFSKTSTSFVSRLSQACLTARETRLLLYGHDLGHLYQTKFTIFCAIHFVCSHKELNKATTSLSKFVIKNCSETVFPRLELNRDRDRVLDGCQRISKNAGETSPER